ncbi:POK19 protein, partial [Cochlearius cochlearius]|nr:POK19 protein [Cochlearius cochlearius]
IIDIKDCFFSIPLHPKDTKRFAFSVPTVNNAAPARRYEWVVLPQGMKNSPVICQWYVDQALQEWKAKEPHTIVYHYTDDILVATPDPLTSTQKENLISTLK